MKFKTTIKLLALVIALGVITWFARDVRRHEYGTPEPVLPGLVIDEVTRISVGFTNFTVVCERTGDGWFIVTPLRVRADVGEISRVLSAVEALSRTTVVTPEQRTDRDVTLDDYGVGKQVTATVCLTDRSGKKTLLLGSRGLEGDVLYARLASSDEVIVTQPQILDTLPHSVNALRDRRVVRGDIAGVVRLDIKRALDTFIKTERIKMVKRAGSWIMQSPTENARLNGQRVLDLLKSLFELRVTEFVARDATTGLTAELAALEITFWTDEGGAGKRFFFSRESKGAVYAAQGDDKQAYLVDSAILADFKVRPNALRDRTLFAIAPQAARCVRLRDGERVLTLVRKPGDGWRVTEPRQWKADEDIVGELLLRLASLKVAAFIDTGGAGLEQYGLEEAARTMEVSTVAVPPRGQATGVPVGRRLLVGKEATEGGWYARFEDEDKSSVFRVESPGLKSTLTGEYRAVEQSPDASDGGTRSAQRWVSPLLYCSRMMLRIEPSTVTSITVVKAGVTEAVRRDAAGKWRPVPPLTGRADEDVVNDILLMVSNLRATKIVWREKEAMASYGLDKPGISLTLGLTGGQGIGRTLGMGFLSGTDGVYAIVQGRDVVFVLPKESVGKVARDLVAGVKHGG